MSKDFLLLLLNQSKWHRQGNNLKKSELVLVVGEKTPRSARKLARVVEAEAKVDKHVQKAIVGLAGGNMIL